MKNGVIIMASSMNTALAIGEDNMTDFQFKAIMAMVFDMLEKCRTIEDLNETKQVIAKLCGDLVSPPDGEQEV